MLETIADIFVTEDSKNLLFNKYVIFIGDSVIRSMYKDFVKLLQINDHLTDQQLKVKGEFYFENDVLLEGGQKGIMSNETSYTEVREFRTEYHLVKFYFITRCYSDYLLSICNDIKNDSEKPDVVIMNSGVWDLTRYGSNSIPEYKQNLPKGIYSLIKVLPSYTLFIWCTTLPLSKDIKGGFIIPEIEHNSSKMREDVLEANFYASKVLEELKLDVLDLHFYFINQIQRRAKDGIHWDATAHRRITNMILNHICDAWNVPPPYRILENPQSNVSNNTNSNQLPASLKNKLNGIDLNRHLFTIPNDKLLPKLTDKCNEDKKVKNTKNFKGINNQSNIVKKKAVKRKRSQSQEGLSSFDDDINNNHNNKKTKRLNMNQNPFTNSNCNPTPLMALNLDITNNTYATFQSLNINPTTVLDDFTNNGNLFSAPFHDQNVLNQNPFLNGLYMKF